MVDVHQLPYTPNDIMAALWLTGLPPELNYKEERTNSIFTSLAREPYDYFEISAAIPC